MNKIEEYKLLNENNFKLATELSILIQRSCTLLKKYEPQEGYFGCFSGGKDSVCIKELAKLANVKVTWHYHNTTIDPPELVHFIYKYHKDVIIDKPKHGNFFNRVVEKCFMPTRFRRWCCREYKEILGPKNTVKIIGIRVSESSKRRKRYTECTSKECGNRMNVYPIRLWSDKNIWDFIAYRKLEYCSLYDEGFKRIGCVMCPLQTVSGRLMDAKRWPKYEQAWKRASYKVYNKRKELGKNMFPKEAKSAEDAWNWWINCK